MKTNMSIIIGVALVASALTLSAQQGPGRGCGAGGQGGKGQVNPPCLAQDGGSVTNCPNYGQGKGQGRCFRSGPRDGSGPRRDGSCGQRQNQT